MGSAQLMAAPPPPPGFTLDQGVPPPPPGFMLDSQPRKAAAASKPKGIDWAKLLSDQLNPAGAVARYVSQPGFLPGIEHGLNYVMRSAIDPLAAGLEKHSSTIAAGVPVLAPSIMGIRALEHAGVPTAQQANAQHVQLTQDLQAQSGAKPGFRGGTLAGMMAGSAPLMAAGGEALAPLRAAPVIGPAAEFMSGSGGLASRAANSALQGGAGAYLTNKSSDMPLWQQMLIGTAVGGAIPFVEAGAEKVAEGIKGVASTMGALNPKHFKEPLTEEGRQQITARLLTGVTGGDVPEMRPAPLPGMQLSPGEASGNRGLLWLERGAEQVNPQVGSTYGANRAANEDAIRSAIGQIGDLTSNAPGAMEARLEAAQEASRNATRTLWKAANVDEQTSVPTNWLRARTTDYLGGLKVAERKVIGPDILSTLEDLPDNTNLGEIQAWRADIGDKVRAAYRAGEDNRARILGGLQSVVSDFTDELPLMGATKPSDEAMAAYNAARQATRQMKKTFTQPGPIRNALGVDRYGADRVPTSAMADQFIKPNTSKGAPEALQAYLKAVGSDSEAQQAARDAFAQKFLTDVQTSVTSPEGGRGISTAAVRRFTDKYQHVIDSPLFDATQKKFIRSIADAADMASLRATTKAATGTDTAGKLAASMFMRPDSKSLTYLDALLGPQTVRATDAALTTATIAGGLATGTSPIGLGATALSGAGVHRLTRPVLGAIYGASQEQVEALMAEALTDPELARTLMMKATPASESMIRPVVRQKLLTILRHVPSYAFTIPAQRALAAPARVTP